MLDYTKLYLTDGVYFVCMPLNMQIVTDSLMFEAVVERMRTKLFFDVAKHLPRTELWFVIP
jgi:hypothetical protein